MQLAIFFHPRNRLRHSKDVIARLDKLEQITETPDLAMVYSELWDLNIAYGSESREIAKKVFKWIIASKTPLKLKDLSAAAAYRSSGDLDAEADENFVNALCSNFIFIEQTGLVRFAHISVRDYLLETKSAEFTLELAHAQIATTCLAYLNFTDVCIDLVGERLPDDDKPDAEKPSDEEATGEEAVDYRLVEGFFAMPGIMQYAVLLWPVHCSVLSDSQRDRGELGRMLKLFMSEARLAERSAAKSQFISRIFRKTVDWEEDESFDIEPYEASLTRMFDAWARLVQQLFRVRDLWNYKREKLREKHYLSVILDEELRFSFKYLVPGLVWEIPLYTAAAWGFSEYIKELLDSKNSYPEKVIQRMIEFSMYLASSYGREQVLKLLLDAIPASSPMLAFEDFWRETCLIKAAKFGHTSIATLLLDKGADVDLARGFSKTPLYHASRNNHIDMVRLLIERGATVDEFDHQGRTPLFRACRYRYAAIVEVLLQHGADLHLTDGFGIDPLHIYLFGGDEGEDDSEALMDLICKFTRSMDWLNEDLGGVRSASRMRCVRFGTYEPGSPGRGLRNSGVDDYIEPIGI